MKKYDYPDFGQITLIKANPFLIKNEKGALLAFNDYREMYLHVMRLVKKYFPKGYMDLPVLLAWMCHFSEDKCMRINERAMRMYKEFRESCIIIKWRFYRMEAQRFTNLMKVLHTITESDFDTYQFQLAWEDFCDELYYEQNPNEYK